MARQHISILGCSDQAMVGSSIMDNNMPPCIQSGTDMSAKLPSLINYMTMRIKTGLGGTLHTSR